MTLDIRNATALRCIEEQNEARTSHFYVERYLAQGPLGHGHAIQAQQESAYHYKAMWMRLERLLGIA